MNLTFTIEVSGVAEATGYVLTVNKNGTLVRTTNYTLAQFGTGILEQVVDVLDGDIVEFSIVATNAYGSSAPEVDSVIVSIVPPESPVIIDITY